MDMEELEDIEMIELHDGELVEKDDSDIVELHNGEFAYLDDTTVCASDDEYYITDDLGCNEISWCHHYEAYYFEDDMIWGYINGGDEGWFHQDANYAHSSFDDVYFLNDYCAENHGYIWSERQEDWLPEDEWNGEEEGGEEYCNEFTVDSKRFDKTFGMKYSFGVEIETCSGYADYSSTLSLSSVADGSINGKEYVTGVLYGNNGIDMLKRICFHLKNSDCLVDKSCGIHVHIGEANFNRRFSMLSIMLGMMLQQELYSYMPKSRNNNTYCKWIPEKYSGLKIINKKLYPRTYKRMLNLISDYVYNGKEFGKDNNKKVRHPGGHYHDSRYKWLNLNNCSYKDGPNTIEFRLHSGSVDYNKIYNWITVCMCFVNYIENHSRKIIDCWKQYTSRIKTDDFGLTMEHDIISLNDILQAGINKENADRINKYYTDRYMKFKID